MAWTAPRTWSASETVTATNMNLHIKDNLNAIAPLVDGPTYTTWTPTLTNMTLGNGTVVARYTQIGKLVAGQFRFTLGSTSTIGTTPQFSVPVTMNSNWTTAVPLGPVWCLDSGTAIYYGICRPTSTTAAICYITNTASTYATENNITSTVPFTWTTSDQLVVPFVYEAA